MSPDPAGQYFSPYLGMGNNPIKRLDPDGRDDFYFNADGYCTNKVEYSWFRNLFFGHTGYLDDGTEFRISSIDANNIHVFENGFNENDMFIALAENKDALIQAKFISDEQISKWLSNSGVYKKENRGLIERYIYALTKSDGPSLKEAPLDFVNLFTSDNPSMYVVADLTSRSGSYAGHNAFNMGNFLWGAALQGLGVPYNQAKMAAHLHSIFKQGNILGDSADDQFSIKSGYYWGAN